MCPLENDIGLLRAGAILKYLHFKQSQHIDDLSAAHVVISLVSSAILKRRLLTMIVRPPYETSIHDLHCTDRTRTPSSIAWHSPKRPPFCEKLGYSRLKHVKHSKIVPRRACGQDLKPCY